MEKPHKKSHALFGIKQVKNILPTDFLKILYFTLIQPHLTYQILPWGNANSTALHKTILLQKRAIRIMNKAQYNSHTEPLFKKSKILKVKDMFEYQVIQFMNDFLMRKLPFSFDKTYRLNCEIQATHHTRQHNLIFIERCNSTVARKLPYYTFPILCNKNSSSIQVPGKESNEEYYSSFICRDCEMLKLSL